MRNNFFYFLSLVLCLFCLSIVLTQDTSAQTKTSFLKSPLSFEINKGQSDKHVKFLSRNKEHTLFLTPNEAVLSLKPLKNRKGDTVRIKFVGANQDPKLTGVSELPGKVNYFIGNNPKKWLTNISTYKKVKYKNIYPGIDLICYGNQEKLEYDLVVAPNTDPTKITLKFEGAKKLKLNKEGNLILHTGQGEIIQQKPIIYQELSGLKKEITGGYILKANNEVGFQISNYDTKRSLVIDPTIFYSTYLGGTERDDGQAIAVDKSGSAYIVGRTTSVNFPTTMGAFQDIKNSSFDIFVTKLNADGTLLNYSTYIGGSSDEGAELGNEGSIAVDASGNVYITGLTSSADFPVTMGAFQNAYGGGSTDAFVAKLNAEGNSLVYSTYLGGSGRENDFGGGVAVSADGNAYVTGSTDSTDFPIKNALNPTNSGGLDVFITKFNTEGSALDYSTYLGGSEDDRGFRIAVDKFGNSFVTGWILSSDFPTSNGAFQTMNNAGFDAFVTKLNAAGNTLVYSTYLGGSASDFGEGIAVDTLGNAYVTLHTESTDFPTTTNSFQPSFGGTADAAVSKLNIEGNDLVYSTYVGGNGFDESLGIAVDPEGNAYITGFTSSSDFPTKSALQSNSHGSDDIFVTKLNKTGNSVIYSTYLGGNGDDRGFGIAVDASSDAYVTGHTTSTDFPKQNPIQSVNEGSHDAFIAKIASISSGISDGSGPSSSGGSSDEEEPEPAPGLNLSGDTSLIAKPDEKNVLNLLATANNFSTKTVCKVSSSSEIPIKIGPKKFVLSSQKSEQKIKVKVPFSTKLASSGDSTVTINVSCKNGTSDEIDILVTASFQ